MVQLIGKEAYPFYFGARPELLRIAANLRKNMTPAEKVLWEQLRNRQLMGCRFRRQHPIFEFVVDFFCYEAMLVIEVDGDVHEDSFQAERDAERTKILKGFGINELRFRNEEVMHNAEGVLKRIEDELRQSL
jgi:very-short-patch-repair endonuclease